MNAVGYTLIDQLSPEEVVWIDFPEDNLGNCSSKRDLHFGSCRSCPANPPN